MAARPGHMLPQTPLKKLDQFHLRLLGIFWEVRVTNQEVLRHSSMPDVVVLIMKVQLRWTGHAMRMADSRLPKQIFCSELARGTRRYGARESATKSPSRTPCASVTSLLKAGNILQQIAPLGGWQPTTEPKLSRRGDCHSLTSNARPGKRRRPAPLLS